MAKKGTDFLERLEKHIAHTRCAHTVDKLRGGPEAVRMEYSKQLKKPVRDNMFRHLARKRKHA
jgi:hypothetical protein